MKCNKIIIQKIVRRGESRWRWKVSKSALQKELVDIRSLTYGIYHYPINVVSDKQALAKIKSCIMQNQVKAMQKLSDSISDLSTLIYS
jgi:2C-methyl-D-erythritol 2,4-cyclodiphosphate synthase